MVYIVNVTSKGQATIPISIRKKLGIKPGEKVIFEETEDQKVVLTRVLTIAELKGSLKSKIKYSDRKADKAISKMFAKEYGKTS